MPVQLLKHVEYFCTCRRPLIKFGMQDEFRKIKSVRVSGDLLKLINNSLNNRFLRVLLNGRTSGWLPIKAGVPQESALGLLFFLIYDNILPDNLVSSVKIFADDTARFSTVHETDSSRTALKNDLKKISE